LFSSIPSGYTKEIARKSVSVVWLLGILLMCFVKYFQNFYENRCNSDAPVFFQDAGCMSFLHGVDSDTSDATFGFYILLALKMLQRKKKRVQLIKPKHDVISAHCTHGGRRLNIETKCKFTFATSFKLSALK